MPADSAAHPQLARLLAQVHAHILADIRQDHLSLPAAPAALPTAPRPPTRSSGSLGGRGQRRAKSEFSAEERARVREVREEMANFERSLEMKDWEVLGREKQQKEEERSRRQEQLEGQRRERRRQLSLRKQLRWQQKRMEEHQRSPTSPRSLTTRPLFLQLQERSLLQRQLHHQQIQQALALISQQNRAVDLRTLPHHAHHYAQQLQANRDHRRQRLQQIRETALQIEEKEQAARPKSKFYLRVQQLEAEKQQRLQQQEDSRRNQRQRIKLFMQQLRDHPRLRPRSPSPSRAPPSDSPLRRQLSPQQLREQGNRFMRESVLRTSATQPVRALPDPVPPASPPDYLRELRALRRKTAEQQHTGSLLSLTQIKISKILASSLPQEHKVERLKKLAAKLEIGVGVGGNVEIERLQAKLSILDATLRSQE